MKCIECGHELKDGAIFCIRCGAMQVSMDGTPIEREEGWAEVNPASQPVNNSRPVGGGRHMSEFSEAPQRNVGRIIAVVVAIAAVIAAIIAGLTMCTGPGTSGSGSAATTTTASTATSSEASGSTTSASATSASASSASASASAASASAEAAAANAGNQPAAQQATPVIVNEQPQQQPQAQQQQPATTAPTSGDYVLGDSSSRYYSRDELNNMSTSDLYYARNEIFARHGRMFQRADLQEYFNSKSWYTPIYTPEQWNSLPNQLNDCELKNSELMRQVEQAKGSPYL